MTSVMVIVAVQSQVPFTYKTTTLGDVSSGFQSQSVLPYSHCAGECNVCSPRSTSGATLADLLAASVQPVLSPHTVAEMKLPGFELVLSEYL